METWIQKYKPKTIDDLIYDDHICNTINSIIEKKDTGHLMICGSNGCGKTTIMKLICSLIYENNNYKNYLYLESNTSERSIGIVRDVICTFTKSKGFNKDVQLRIIVIDDADSITQDAQFCLRRIIEKYSNTIRFCFICSNEQNMIPALRSRCSLLNISQISKDKYNKFLDKIAIENNININENYKKYIIETANNNIRKAIIMMYKLYLNILLPINNISKKEIKNWFELKNIYNITDYELFLILYLKNINKIFKKSPHFIQKLYKIDLVLSQLQNNPICVNNIIQIFSKL